MQVARRARSCLLQAAIATHERHVTLDPRSELIVSCLLFIKINKIKFSNGKMFYEYQNWNDLNQLIKISDLNHEFD